MTAAELVELYLKQFDSTYEEHVLSTEPNALSTWEKWIGEDPERAWPVFLEIVARRRDDEVLYQVGHRLRLLLARHWHAFHERAEDLVRATPRFALIVGEEFFDPETWVEKPLDVEALIEAHERMVAHGSDRYLIDDIIRQDGQRGLRLAVEIIHRGPQYGADSFDTFSPLQALIDAHGTVVIDQVEELARHSVLLRRCLWRMNARERNTPPHEGVMAEVWRRALAAAGETTDFTDDDAPLPAPQMLNAEDERLLEAWFIHEANFWSFDALSTLVSDEPETAWPIVLRLIDRAEGQAIYTLAAGPLEDLLAGHGPAFIDRIAEEARRNPKLAEAVGGVWLNENDAVYERFQNLLAELA